MDNKVRLNTHMQHLESLVMYGKDGLNEINNHIFNFIRSFDDVNDMTITKKLDGAPAVQIYSKIGGGYPNYGIGLKSLLSSPDNAITTDDEIEAKYNDRPNMAAMLMFCLRLAHSIPAGEIWQGDCLFTSNTKKEKTINGEKCVVFQPNKILYSFSENNPDYNKIKSANFGICFHTIYKKTDKGIGQSFKVDPTRLSNVQDDIYILSPSVDMKQVDIDLSGLESDYNNLITLEKKLDNNPYYHDLCNNKVFMRFWQMFENHITADKASTKIDTKTFYDELKNFIEDKMNKEYTVRSSKLKTDTGKEKAKIKYDNSILELEQLLEQHREVLTDIVNVFNKVVDIKMKIFNSLKEVKDNYGSYLLKKTGELELTSGEGFAMSDADGNVVKIVDRSKFSNANRSNEYTSGFEHNESLEEDTDESYDPKNMVNTVANTNRDPYIKANKEWDKMKVKKLKKGQMIVSSLEEGINKATPYMLRNDGELFTCGKWHPYVSEIYDNRRDDLESLVRERLYELNWFYNHTNSDQTKKHIKIIYKSSLELGIAYKDNYTIDNLGIDDQNIYIADEEELYKLLDLLNKECNQEFCKVRTSDLKYGGSSDEIYFRIGSVGFNWFDIIWKVCFENKNNISDITISKDRVARDFDQGEIYKVNGKKIEHMPIDEFLTLKGRPIIEKLNLGNNLLDEAYDVLSKGSLLSEKIELNPRHLINLYNVLKGKDTLEMNMINEKIVKKGSQWQVQSEKGRNMGTYDTKEEAEKRLKQVHYFKYKNEDYEVGSDEYKKINEIIRYLINKLRYMNYKIGSRSLFHNGKHNIGVNGDKETAVKLQKFIRNELKKEGIETYVALETCNDNVYDYNIVVFFPNEEDKGRLLAVRDIDELDEGKKHTVIYRGENDDNYSNKYEDYAGVFFASTYEDAESFGDVTSYIIRDDAKIFEYKNSDTFVFDNGYNKKEYPEIYDAFGVKSMDQVANMTQEERQEYSKITRGDYYLLWEFVEQYIAKIELDKQGYDGAHWLHEDWGIGSQYQIWNLDCLETDYGQNINEGREEQNWFYNKLQDLAQDYKLGRLSKKYALQDLKGFEQRLTDLFRKGKVSKGESNKLLRQINSYRSLVMENLDEEFSSFGEFDD